MNRWLPRLGIVSIGLRVVGVVIAVAGLVALATDYAFPVPVSPLLGVLIYLAGEALRLVLQGVRLRGSGLRGPKPPDPF